MAVARWRLRTGPPSAATACRMRRRSALPHLRLDACPRPSRARSAGHRAYGLRRLLCRHRETRRSFAERQAADRGRGSARRGLHRLLHRPQIWRALGHADVPGQKALPPGGDPQAAPCLLQRGGAPDPRLHGGADAAGRTAVAGRSLSRPVRHRPHPSQISRPDHGGAGDSVSSARSASPFPSVFPATSSWPSWRQRTGQAARLCRDRHGGSASPSCATRRSGSCAAPARSRRRPWNATALSPSASCRTPTRRPGAALWRHRPVAVPHGQCPGLPPRRSRRRDEVHLVRNHLRQGSVAAMPNWKASCGGRPSGSRPAPRQRACRQDHGAEAEDGGFPAAHPLAPRWRRRPNWPTASSAPPRQP